MSDKIKIFIHAFKTNVVTTWKELDKATSNYRRISVSSSRLVWKYWHQNVSGLKDAVALIESRCKTCRCKDCSAALLLPKNGGEPYVPCFLFDIFRQNSVYIGRKSNVISNGNCRCYNHDDDDDVILDRLPSGTTSSTTTSTMSTLPRHRRFPNYLRSLKLLLLILCFKCRRDWSPEIVQIVLESASLLHRIDSDYSDRGHHLLLCGSRLISGIEEIERKKIMMNESIRRTLNGYSWWKLYQHGIRGLFQVLRKLERKQLATLLRVEIGRKRRTTDDKFADEDIPPMNFVVSRKITN